MGDLQDPAVVDLVLGPRSREILDAPDLDARDAAARPPDPMAMGVPAM